MSSGPDSVSTGHDSVSPGRDPAGAGGDAASGDRGSPSADPADGGRGDGDAPAPVVGIVPAAGRSSRMGSPKPLLDAGGPSFLQRVVGALSRGGCRPVLVVVRETDGPVAAMARRAGALAVENPDPSDGPISSLRAALRSLREPVAGCAFCPVDHPRVSPETVAALLEAFRGGDDPVVVPRHGDRRGHPVLFRRAVFAELLEEELEEGARTVLRRHEDRVRELPVDDPGILVDIDTRAEYRRHFPEAYRRRFQSR